MRITRVRLRNWRGVEDREVRLAPTGLTIVEGPNEAGKSSLVEALDLLFDELDSTKKSSVLAVKPVHRDEGAEVEADVDTGTHALTYSKRFHKRPSTTLSVSRPGAENLTGREAHERARAILEESVDVPLWKALRVAQGGGLAQADLGGQRWLSAALDRAAGGDAGGGAREEALFERVAAEKDRWWTAAWSAKKELEGARTNAASLDAEVARLRDLVTAFDTDAERVAALDREVRRLDEDLAGLVARATDAEQQAARVLGLGADAERAGGALAAADARRARAQADVERRRELARLAADAAAHVDAAEKSLAAIAPDLADTLAAMSSAERGAAAASAAAEAASAAAALRELDLQRSRDELDLAQLGERLQRIVGADQAGAAAETVAATNRCDAKQLAVVRAAHERRIEARVRLEAASPTVIVSALGAITPRIDGAEHAMAAGSVRELVVSGSAQVDVPGVVRVEVRSGTGTSEPRATFENAERGLAKACAAAGVASLEEAVAAHEALTDARRALADRDRITKENLRDLSREILERKVVSLRERVGRPVTRPPGAPPAPATFDEADDLARRAKDAAAGAASARDEAAARRDALRQRHDEAGGRVRDCEVTLRLRRETAEELRTRLDAARAATSDQILDAALADSDTAHASAAAAARDAAARLAAAEPDVVRRIHDAARSAVERARKDRQARHEDGVRLRAGLEVRGDEGLAARLGQAESALDAARLDLARREAQAAAARLLFETLAAERSAERSRYVAPFREKVESLGRIVFGPSFAIEIESDLTIVRRTLDGRTVDFESLSGGAKEQLGVIGRLACALLAAEEGGVPVILDDAFGFSDPDRLERMGVLLETAARTCQVVLLTCDPARARRFPGATVVSFR